MTSFPLSFGYVLGLLLVLVRVSALVTTAPVISARAIPARVKVGLALVMALVAFFAAGAPRVPLPTSIGGLVALVVAETAIGLAAGLASRLLLEAAQYGGQAASNAMGFGFGQVLNPASGAESTTVGELFSVLASAAALSLGVHREALAWIARSVREVPPGATLEVAPLAGAMVHQVILALTLAVRVSYPVFAAALFGYGLLGALGKAAPQLSISNLGFAVTTIAGGGAVYLVAPEAAQVCAQAALQVFSRG